MSILGKKASKGSGARLNAKQYAAFIADKKRLDWLLAYIQRHGTNGVVTVWSYSKGGPLGRDAIDRAIADLDNHRVSADAGRKPIISISTLCLRKLTLNRQPDNSRRWLWTHG